MTIPHPIFTIGHSNHSAEEFLALLQEHNVEEVADVRSSPYTRNPYGAHFNREPLAALLEERGIEYRFMGGELGGRPADRSCYDAQGRVRYERLARTDEFFSGISDLLRDAGKRRVALMCSEREPLDCHRTLLIAHVLTSEAYGVEAEQMQHILADGGIEPHDATMYRLVDGTASRKSQVRQFDMFGAPSVGDKMAEVIEKAVRLRETRVAYRLGSGARANVEEDLWL